MIVGIVGSRTLDCYELICEKIPKYATEIISGGADGVDALARKYALSRGLKLTEFLPRYKSYGRRATLVRNLELIRACDVVYIFWDNKSNGTRHVIKSCLDEQIPMEVFVVR